MSWEIREGERLGDKRSIELGGQRRWNVGKDVE